jgi:hypothetical protein
METLIILGMMLAWPVIAIGAVMASYYLLKAIALMITFGPFLIMHGYNSVREKLGYNDNEDNQLQITPVSAIPVKIAKESLAAQKPQITHLRTAKDKRESINEIGLSNNRQ